MLNLLREWQDDRIDNNIKIHPALLSPLTYPSDAVLFFKHVSSMFDETIKNFDGYILKGSILVFYPVYCDSEGFKILH